MEKNKQCKNCRDITIKFYILLIFFILSTSMLILKSEGYKLNRLQGESMCPTIPDKTIVITKDVGYEEKYNLSIGDVVVYISELDDSKDGVLHRIIDKGDDVYYIAGDNSFSLKEYVSAQRIKSKLVWILFDGEKCKN